MVKYLTLFILLTIISCKTAYVTSYTFPLQQEKTRGYYQIHLEDQSFQHLQPITVSNSGMAYVNEEWVNYSDDVVVGCALNFNEKSSFHYLLEKAINPSGASHIIGDIVVHRLQHSSKPDIAPGLSVMTLFIPNIVGLPIRSNKVEDAYLFEVYSTDGEMVYRAIHSGIGKAKCGFYYGYKNSDEKAGYDAAYNAIQSFVEDFK